MKHPVKKCVNFINVVMGINASEIPCEIPCEKIFEHQIYIYIYIYVIMGIKACEIPCEKKF